MRNGQDFEIVSPWVGAAKSAEADGRTSAALTAPRLAWRLAEIARALGFFGRAIERERSAWWSPKPDFTIGRMPLWRVETTRGWGGGKGK